MGIIMGPFKTGGLLGGEETVVMLQGVPPDGATFGLASVSRSLLSERVTSFLSLVLSTLYYSLNFETLW